MNSLPAGFIEFCQELIRRPSYTGQEAEAALFIQERMIKLGYDKAWLDESGNVIGVIEGKLKGPKILFDGHMDTVAVSDEDKWSVAPFGGVIKDGYLYGRGASDMKGALGAMIYGLAPLTKQKESLAGSIYVSGTVCEETFEGIALGQVVEAIQPDYVVIGEASNLSLKRGQRGRAEIAVTTFGKAAHSSNPAVGKNAVLMMMQLLQEIKEVSTPHDDFLGEGILELTDIISAPYPGASVVPHFCRITFDRRLLVGETEESVLAPLKACIDRLIAADPAFKAEVNIVEADQKCHTGKVLAGKRFFPAWVLPETHLFVEKALTGLKTIGLEPEVTKYSFCTNGSYSAGIAKIPTIGFGPGREDGAHIVDEKIEIKQLECAAKGYEAIALQLLAQGIK